MDMDVLYDLSAVLESDLCRKELVVTFTWTEVNDEQEKQCKKTVKDINKAYEFIRKLSNTQSDNIRDLKFNASFKVEGSIDLDVLDASDIARVNGAEMNDKELAKQISLAAVSGRGINMSIVQRRFCIGYARAAKIIDRLEAIGVIKRKESNSLITQYDIVVSKDKLVEIIENNF